MNKVLFTEGIFLGEFEGKNIYRSKTTTSIPILEFLNSSIFPKFFFKKKDDETLYLAVGSLLFLSPEKALRKFDLNLRIYGAIAFDNKPDPTWDGYHENGFFIPEYELIVENKKTTFYHYSFDPKPIELIITKKPKATRTIQVKKVKNFPDVTNWIKLINKQKNACKKGLLDKIVLCRKTLFTLNDTPSFPSLLENLLKLPKSHIFASIISEDKGFFGASPETLFSRTRELLKTEAIAATRKRGKDKTEDKILEEELKTNPKDLHEFSYVKNAIENCLLSLSNEVTVDKLSVYKNPYIQHLHTTFSAKTNADSLTIIDALHPTPAIGGFPKKKAFSRILKLEPFSRKLYSSVIGIKGKDEEVFAVAIRSFLLDKNTLHLYAGVGIIESSDPLLEWEELDIKMQAILQGAGFESE